MHVKITRPQEIAGHAPDGSIVVYGAQGCGKTQHAEAMRLAFGCTSIADDWRPWDPRPAGALCLTHMQVEGAISYDEAMALVKGVPVLSAEQIEAGHQVTGFPRDRSRA